MIPDILISVSKWLSGTSKGYRIGYLGNHNKSTLQWRHNESDGVSDHQPNDCLLIRLFRRRSKKTPRLRSASKASNAENVSIWWRHHIIPHYFVGCDILPLSWLLRPSSRWRLTCTGFFDWKDTIIVRSSYLYNRIPYTFNDECIQASGANIHIRLLQAYITEKCSPSSMHGNPAGNEYSYLFNILFQFLNPTQRVFSCRYIQEDRAKNLWVTKRLLQHGL